MYVDPRANLLADVKVSIINGDELAVGVIVTTGVGVSLGGGNVIVGVGVLEVVGVNLIIVGVGLLVGIGVGDAAIMTGDVNEGVDVEMLILGVKTDNA